MVQKYWQALKNTFKKYLPVRSPAFSLVEVLVVMGIVGILASIVLVATNSTRQFALVDDAKRKKDVSDVLGAVDRLKLDAKGLPGNLSEPSVPRRITNSLADATNVDLCFLVTGGYLTKLPRDPALGSDITNCQTAYDTGYYIVFHPDGVHQGVWAPLSANTVVYAGVIDTRYFVTGVVPTALVTLANTPTPSITLTPSPTLTLTPSATPTPTSNLTNTPTPTPSISYWTAGTTGGTARYGHTANVYGSKMYVWGGSNAGYLNTMDIYDITNNTWSTGAAGGTARRYHTSGINGDKIYYWGGTNGSNLNTLDIYDITNNTWSTGAAGGTARYGHGSVIYGGKIYSFLGSNGSPLYSVDIYNIAGNSWSTGASDFTQSRYFFPAFRYYDKMYSWAGGNGGANTMRIYNMTTNTHSAGTTGGTARYYVGAVTYNGKMYSWAGFGGSNIVDIFDPLTNTWTTGTAGGSSRYGHSSVVYGNKIINWGGINGPYLNTMDIYNISEPAPTATPTPTRTPTPTPICNPICPP